MDMEGYVEYWRRTSERSMRVIPVLMTGEFHWEALFHMHLVVEKAMKAHVVHQTQAHAPRIHDLHRLAALAQLNLSELQRQTCTDLMAYQIEGRYDDPRKSEPSVEITTDLVSGGQELAEWLIRKL